MAVMGDRHVSHGSFAYKTKKTYLNPDEFSNKHNKFSWSELKSAKSITHVHKGYSKYNLATIPSLFDSF